MKLKTADHISTIIQILSADTWLLDIGWEKSKNDMEFDEITLPDRATKTAGGFMMIEIAPTELRESDRPRWSGRAEWEQDRQTKLITPPLAKPWFKRQDRKKIGDEIVRTFSTPALGILARTYESENQILRIEFIQRIPPYIDGLNNVIRTLTGDEIPAVNASAAKAKPTYDVVTQKALTDAITDAAIANMISDGDYATRAEIFADYQSFDLEAAIHNGFPLSPKVEDDLSLIEFDAENTMLVFDAIGFQGINTIKDFTFAAVMAGGDWEHPIIFILYISNGELRGYIPDEGNVYNRKTSKAYGNSADEDDILEDLNNTNWDVTALRRGVSKAFSLGATDQKSNNDG